jgi:hypothetical protein
MDFSSGGLDFQVIRTPPPPSGSPAVVGATVLCNRYFLSQTKWGWRYIGGWLYFSLRLTPPCSRFPVCFGTYVAWIFNFFRATYPSHLVGFINVIQPVTDENYEAYCYEIDFSVLISPVLCPNIHFAILFSHILKVRNEILRTYEHTVLQDLSPCTVVEFGNFFECGCCLILRMEALLCYQTTRLNTVEEYSSMRNLCIILLSEMWPERYVLRACLAYPVLCSESGVGDFVWTSGTFQPDYTASHSRRQ